VRALFFESAGAREGAVPALERWADEQPQQSLAPYLLARQAWLRGELQGAATLLDRALQLGLPTEDFTREARLLRFDLALGLRDEARARQLLTGLLSDTGVPSGRRRVLSDFARRWGLLGAVTLEVGSGERSR